MYLHIVGILIPVFFPIGFLIPALALVLIQFAKCDKVVGKEISCL